jgi:hypothetical protein
MGYSKAENSGVQKKPADAAVTPAGEGALRWARSGRELGLGGVVADDGAHLFAELIAAAFCG